LSLRDRILSATAQFKPVAVECPEIGCTVWVRPMSLGCVARVQAAGGDTLKTSVAMLTDCVCDENGVRVFTVADEAAILDLPSAVTNRLMGAVTKHSGTDDKEADPAGN
jgi:hypothetical protein